MKYQVSLREKTCKNKMLFSHVKSSPLLWLHNRSRLSQQRKMVWYFIGVNVINRTLHGYLEIRNFSSRVERNFFAFGYFSTLEEKFRISARPCYIVYLWKWTYDCEFLDRPDLFVHNRPFWPSNSLSTHSKMKFKLWWTISYKSLYFVTPHLQLVRFFIGMRKQSIVFFRDNEKLFLHFIALTFAGNTYCVYEQSSPHIHTD